MINLHKVIKYDVLTTLLQHNACTITTVCYAATRWQHFSNSYYTTTTDNILSNNSLKSLRYKHFVQ